MSAKSTPQLRHHKGVGQGYVWLDGRQVYLGAWPREASEPPEKVVAEYRRVLALWLTGAPANTGPDGPTVAELACAYLAHAEVYYRKHGEVTSQVSRIKLALGPVCELYGALAAREFGPLALQAVREEMIRRDWTRGYINSCVGCLQRVWQWGVSREYFSDEVYRRLLSVESLKEGRSAARESKEILPVPLADLNKVWPELGRVVGDLVLVQYLAGMRPTEACELRPDWIHLDGLDPEGQRHEGVWCYHAPSKTEHHGYDRPVFLGPRAQAVLEPYMNRPRHQWLFDPAEAVLEWLETLLAGWEAAGRERPQRLPGIPKRPGPRYTTHALRHALRRACKRAGVEKFTALQVRHTRATEIRSWYDEDHARVVLGHHLPGVTAVYARADLEKAARVMREVG